MYRRYKCFGRALFFLTATLGNTRRCHLHSVAHPRRDRRLPIKNPNTGLRQLIYIQTTTSSVITLKFCLLYYRSNIPFSSLFPSLLFLLSIFSTFSTHSECLNNGMIGISAKNFVNHKLAVFALKLESKAPFNNMKKKKEKKEKQN